MNEAPNPDAYDDWQVHYETCEMCTKTNTCREGQKIKRRVEAERATRDLPF